MHLLFEETGKFLAGRILSEADASAQVELDSGKRVKVKAANILLKFEKPEPAQLMAAAQAVASGIELDMAWEFAPEDEFGFADLARDYFSEQATLSEQAGMLLALFEAPHYFRRAGKGRFRKATKEILAQALAAIEKKKQIALQIEAWVKELSAGSCPAAIRDQLYKILFKPDKNAPEYKAVVEASRATHLGPLELLIKAGAIDSPYQFHWKRFLLENFPKGTAFPKLEAPRITDELPLSSARAFSIDDSATTEIDDALSVQGLGSGTVLLGIHIAAPGLAIQPGSAIDQLGRARLSTVYMPGYKITMLPDEVVQAYTLMEGQNCPAVSLYVTLDEATLEIKSSETKLERVFIEANLRHDQLDAVVTTDWLENPAFEHEIDPKPLLDKREQLSFLYRLAKDLKAKREVVRGKPETFNRPDYNYRLVGNNGAEPKGDEQVEISVRQRGAPLDLIVSEAMILANSSWGSWMADLGVPGIYRSQASLAPGVKVRMGTKALPHAGIGVKSYAWSSSPLRRYTDLVNQWQIIACARHGNTAALAAPFKPKDAELFSIISSFDATYAAYNGFQNAMERFWVLKYVQQQGITELPASLFKDNLVRADHLPLVLPVAGAQGLPRWAQVMVRLGDIDEVSLDIHGTVTARLDGGPDDKSAGESAQAPDDESDDDTLAGPIAIAVDLGEGDPAPGDNSAP
ncbi:ribonuclease catalytic domain-containing protein [Rhodoferax fermentans]|uniref:Ribonuclease II n=1 Tax=Rhodoferax fermentans TaxID=28066 RepID=A0A1T1AR28_RHOFE|nr:RNB domain-containing ribonuclease [Rhodoferax fermentans]MBK1684712.1 RNB domain-containing ribonuclease [Rhodoferax fermentans]OOV06561.1 ribonuclease II [Rhodoferax fermentans]